MSDVYFVPFLFLNKKVLVQPMSVFIYIRLLIFLTGTINSHIFLFIYKLYKCVYITVYGSENSYVSWAVSTNVGLISVFLVNITNTNPSNRH
jgi:hypothetical protein